MLSKRVASAALRASSRPLHQTICIAARHQARNLSQQQRRLASSFLLRRSSPLTQQQQHQRSLWRYLTTEVRAAIDKAVESAPVVLFMKGTPETPQCGFSRATVQILGLQGVDPSKFVAFNVLEDQQLREGIKEYSEWPTIPQLYINKEFIGGCDILVSMHQDGSLGKLLEEKGVVLAAENENKSA